MDVCKINVEDSALITSKNSFWWKQATDALLVDKLFADKKYLALYYRLKSLPYFTNICYYLVQLSCILTREILFLK